MNEIREWPKQIRQRRIIAYLLIFGKYENQIQMRREVGDNEELKTSEIYNQKFAIEEHSE